MQTSNIPKVLFISTFTTPFIQDDLEFLKRFFNVRCQIGAGVFRLFSIIYHCFKSDVAFCWFASTYASIAVAMMNILGKNSVIVIGGVDVAKDEKLGYGIWLVPWKAKLISYALRHAQKIIAVDASLAEKARSLAGYEGKNIEIVPTGYDVDFWKMPERTKVQRVLTVAAVNDERRLYVKGVDVLFKAAALLPDVSFIVIGLTKEIAEQFHTPPNVEILPPMDRRLLLPYYQDAKVYCQPSRHEGMSNVLCEAMLCGCIPIATDVGGTRSMLGEAGIIVPAGDSAVLASALRNGLQMSEVSSANARKQIAGRFTKILREQKLLNILHDLE